MFQQNNSETLPEEQENNSQESQHTQNDNQNMNPNQNQPQNYFWRNVPYSDHQIAQKNQIEKLILDFEALPSDRAIHRLYLEKICNKFQQNFLSDYDDVTDFEQLNQINEKQYKQRKQNLESQLSLTPNLIHDWGDKVNFSQLYQIMKIIKSPNRSFYITKDITKEIYFDEVKENLNSEELEYLNNFNGEQEALKWQGIFKNFQVQPINILRKQLDLIKEQEFKKEDQSMCFEIYKIVAFPYSQLGCLQKYDAESQSVHFQLPKNINIEVRANEIEQNPIVNKNSIISLIPNSVFQSNILSFLCIIDLFKLRIVCRYFKTMVEKYWHISQKKEIKDYEIAKDIALNNEHFMNLNIAAQRMKQKLRASVDMIMNIINWEDLQQQIETNQIEIDVYRPLIMMLRLFNKQQVICYHYEINGEFSILQLAKDIKQQIHDYLNLEFLPLSFKQMRQIQQQALSAPEFNLLGVINPELSLGQLLTFLLQALYFHGWMQQMIAIYKEILKKRKKELQIYDQQQNYNNEFLKQAFKYIYKMIDYSPIKDNPEQVEIMIKISKILSESLKHINFDPKANHLIYPSGVIQLRKDVIKIHLDVYFLFEILSYVCCRNKYYFEDVDDSKIKMHFNKVKKLLQTDQKEESSESQTENNDPQPNLNNQYNELD
ncbi:unnamed protein product [Paramecium sonneborni]|uniref:F-box domain-containing protein n=1 Tax=Paramecium sonneborni TaxID=65129 RepID=A0A8S1NPQ1_9CILI|nr:unnamed protein product [Paramecium sonneborni]